jgi:hypothetical protein
MNVMVRVGATCAMEGATVVAVMVATVAAAKPRALADLIERKNCMVGIPVVCAMFFACNEIHVRNFGFMQGTIEIGNQKFRISFNQKCLENLEKQSQ